MARLSEGQRDAFEILRRTYLAQVSARISAIREAATEARRRGCSREALEDLRDRVHRLVGSSAIFGLPRVSDAARALEELATRLLEGDPRAQDLEALTAALEAAWDEAAPPRRRGSER